MLSKVYNVELSQNALKELKVIYRSDKKLYSRICVAIDSLKTDPLQGKQLKGPLVNDRSLRIGNYRIIYTIKHQELMVYIIDMGHRREIYK